MGNKHNYVTGCSIWWFMRKHLDFKVKFLLLVLYYFLCHIRKCIWFTKTLMTFCQSRPQLLKPIRQNLRNCQVWLTFTCIYTYANINLFIHVCAHVDVAYTYVVENALLSLLLPRYSHAVALKCTKCQLKFG